MLFNSNYKLGDPYLNWESLTPYESGTILKKGQLVVLVEGGSKEFPLGIIMQVDEDNNTLPYLLPKYSNGQRPYKATYSLAPLPVSCEVKKDFSYISDKLRRKWTIRKTAESDDGVSIEDGTVYFYDSANNLNFNIPIKSLRSVYGKIEHALEIIEEENLN